MFRVSGPEFVWSSCASRRTPRLRHVPLAPIGMVSTLSPEIPRPADPIFPSDSDRSIPDRSPSFDPTDSASGIRASRALKPRAVHSGSNDILSLLHRRQSTWPSFSCS